MATERIVGIDFGTSTSVIRVKRYKDGVPVGGDRLLTEPVVFNGSYPTVPTLIQRAGEHTYYGFDAQIPKKKSVLHQGFKVNLESGDPERKEEARALTQEFLTYLAGVYKAQSDGGHLGEAGDQVRTVISYPVKWSEETKAFMVEAAKKAGFSNVEGMDEAQAAIHAVTLQSEDYLKKQGYLKQGVPCTMLLIDMGAGTTDLVLCRYTPGEHTKTEVLATWPTKGDALFGGQEVEQILTAYVKEKLPEEETDVVLKRCGRDKFKTWKETVVSPALERDETVESFAELDMIVDLLELDMEPYDLSRSAFEESADGYLKQFPELVRGCIEAAGIKAEEVELVILTGGHSQWYFVKELLAGEKPELGGALLPMIVQDKGRMIPITRPQETVALGLAYLPMSAKLEEKKAPVKKETENTEKKKEEPGEKKDNDVRQQTYGKNFRIHLQVRKSGLFNIVGMGTNGNVYEESVDFSKNNWNVMERTGNLLSSWEKAVLSDSRDPQLVKEAVNELVKNHPDNSHIKEWKAQTEIVEIAGTENGLVGWAGSLRPYGLRKNGTLIIPWSDNDSDIRNTLRRDLLKNWKDIVSIQHEYFWLIGWEKNGGVFLYTDNVYGRGLAPKVYHVPQAVSVACSLRSAVIVKKDGSVEIIYNGDMADKKKDDAMRKALNCWSDIVEVRCSKYGHQIGGRRQNGTVTAISSGGIEMDEVRKWRNIVSIDVNSRGIVGLRSDGTVVGTGSLSELTKKWTSIVEIRIADSFQGEGSCVVGIKENGSIMYSCDYKRDTIGSFFSSKKPPIIYKKTNCILNWSLPPLKKEVLEPDDGGKPDGSCFDLGGGYYLTYKEKRNDYGGYCRVDTCLYRGSRLVRQITDETGYFLDFPGTEHGEWEKDLKIGFQPQTQFMISYNRFGEDGLAEFIWMVQPDGWYWADEHGFGAEKDEEIKLYAKFDKEGRFVTPFHEKKKVIMYQIQINGRTCKRLPVPENLSEKEDIIAFVKAEKDVKEKISGRTILKEIVVPGKLVNLVVK